MNSCRSTQTFETYKARARFWNHSLRKKPGRNGVYGTHMEILTKHGGFCQATCGVLLHHPFKQPPVGPTIFPNEPFGKHVEGLFLV